jgi:hypothetical protein
VHKREPNCNEVSLIDREHLSCNEPDFALGRQNGSVPLKMVRPTIAPRVEETDDEAGRRMPPCDVRTFMPVAVEARKGEVVSGGCAAMLTGDDMVDMEWQWVPRSRQVAVFAAATRTLPNLPR